MGELIVIFQDRNKKTQQDLLIPLNITADQFVRAIKEGFGIVSSKQYLRCENPDALLCGSELLSQFPLRSGMIIYHQG